ncbi:hypothetical protein B14911_09987 [Bacillus sp. NRRL B-14911]|nr:hypothetical protein B14911_09987 [Bacillus sp. NRRL B-14911]
MLKGMPIKEMRNTSNPNTFGIGVYMDIGITIIVTIAIMNEILVNIFRFFLSKLMHLSFYLTGSLLK